MRERLPVSIKDKGECSLPAAQPKAAKLGAGTPPTRIAYEDAVATSTPARTRAPSSASVLDASARIRKGLSGRWEVWRQKLSFSAHRKHERGHGGSLSFALSEETGTGAGDEGGCAEESRVDEQSSMTMTMTSLTGAEDGHGDHGEACDEDEYGDEQQGRANDEGSAEEHTAESEPVYCSEHVDKLKRGERQSFSLHIANSIVFDSNCRPAAGCHHPAQGMAGA